jgi:hypothetical protein
LYSDSYRGYLAFVPARAGLFYVLIDIRLFILEHETLLPNTGFRFAKKLFSSIAAKSGLLFVFFLFSLEFQNWKPLPLVQTY